MSASSLGRCEKSAFFTRSSLDAVKEDEKYSPQNPPNRRVLLCPPTLAVSHTGTLAKLAEICYTFRKFIPVEEEDSCVLSAVMHRGMPHIFF